MKEENKQLSCWLKASNEQSETQRCDQLNGEKWDNFVNNI